MQYPVEINGITVNAVYSEENIEEIFLPLLLKMKDLRERLGRRILVFLAAPPGAGKSTLASFLKFLSENTEGLTPVTMIGMDGFHRYQDYVLSHTIVRDGREYKMVEVKGTPETFDLDLLCARLMRVAAGEECGWPEYNRMTHNPVEDAVKVSGEIVLLEGNYLLLDRPGWSELKQLADLTICVRAEEEMLRERLISRRMKTGTSGEKAAAFVDFSDMHNVRICLSESADADVVLEVQKDGTYRMKG
ncbi:MAG: nucleoside/nucleotide kinase family protein [Lachnospiraceae bacterium]|nr:nucleoside/nucleotide kinase family protein [Lachnospiraceae bacterium]